MKKLPKKLALSRETVRSLGEIGLRAADGGRSDTCVMMCGSDANTGCFATCACTSPIVCE